MGNEVVEMKTYVGLNTEQDTKKWVKHCSFVRQTQMVGKGDFSFSLAGAK